MNCDLDLDLGLGPGLVNFCDSVIIFACLGLECNTGTDTQLILGQLFHFILTIHSIIQKKLALNNQKITMTLNSVLVNRAAGG